MKVSASDIRNQAFEKVFRGFSPEQVDSYLQALSREWERLANENKMLRMQLEIAEKELGRLKDVEMTLFKTLKSAEENSTRITEQAHELAEKYLQESKLQTEDLLGEARKKAGMLLQDAENKAKYLKEEAVNELKNYERDFKAMEKYRDSLIGQLRVLIGNATETIERYEKKFPRESFREKVDELLIRQNDEEDKPELKPRRGSRNPAFARKNEETTETND